MSEVGEVPQGPQPEQQPPQQRLEDLPEFQKLAPEQQERLLAIRERLQAEAMNPQHVVSRSINEMGFFEGLYHTAKPHLEKKKTLMIKDLKATASLTLSLIPLVGQEVGFGKGLFGIYKAEKGLEKFVPAARLARAGKEVGKAAKLTWEGGKAFQAATKVKDVKVLPRIGNAVGKAVEWTTRPIRALWSGGTAPFISLNREFGEHAGRVATKMLGANEVHAARVIAHGEAAEERAKFIQAGLDAAAAAGKNLNQVEWWNVAKKWKRGAIMRGGKAEYARVIREANRNLDNVLEARLAGSGTGKLGTEAYKVAQKVKPTVLEGLGLKKYLALFDQWFNLTPDVPHWLSTTTAIGEFLGAYGIDAIPAVIQLGQDKIKNVGVTWNMGKDVLKYTRDRLLKPDPARKQSAEVFSPAPTVAGAVA